MPLTRSRDDLWPSLPLDDWIDTHDTLHMWTQIVGKIRLALSPMMNQYWQVPLYLTSRGLTTSPIPYEDRTFQIDMDFMDHEMRIAIEDGDSHTVKMKPRTVADFHQATMDALHSLGITLHIWTTPVEQPERIPFEQDTRHASYDEQYAQRFWKILVQADRVMNLFRSRFVGKASPVQLYWGSFDLATSRFSGREAPEHPGFPYVARYVMVEAYSQELSSCGFWPGASLGEPAFYSYFYPEPEGLREAKVKPREAYYNKDFGEFILPYEAVRQSDSPDETLLSFYQSTYDAGAGLAGWNRHALEHTWTPPYTRRQKTLS
jgi:hypothetical protein